MHKVDTFKRVLYTLKPPPSQNRLSTDTNFYFFQNLVGCGLEVTVSSIDSMVRAADNSQEMRNYRNGPPSNYRLTTAGPGLQHSNRGPGSSCRQLAGAEVDDSLKRPLNQLIRAPSSGGVGGTTSRLISIDGASELDAADIRAKEYKVLMGNRKWIQEKNFIEIPPDVEAKLAQQEAQVKEMHFHENCTDGPCQIGHRDCALL